MIFYPLNNVQYNAEDAQLFNCTRNSGVYSKDDFRCEVSGLDNDVTVNLGLGWIRLDRFKGGVFALRDMPQTVSLGIADDTMPRIDVVGVQFNANDNLIKVFSKQGTPAEQPKIPQIVQNENIYELYFCSVKRPAGSTEISPDMVTDLRLDNTYCGLMADSITKIDTVAINSQISALIKNLETEIRNAHDGSAWILKTEAIDYVVEEGTDGIWKFRKWRNGYYEAWGDFETKGNSIGESSIVAQISMPSFSKGLENITYAPLGFSWALRHMPYFEKGENSASVTLYTNPNASYPYYSLSLSINGTWDNSEYEPIKNGNEVAY